MNGAGFAATRPDDAALIDGQTSPADQQPITNHGHSAGKVGAEGTGAQGSAKRAADDKSGAHSLPGWPRLLTLQLAAQYLSISPDSLRNYLAAGDVSAVRPKRPDTRRAHRNQPVNSSELRKLLFDRNELDKLADGWR